MSNMRMIISNIIDTAQLFVTSALLTADNLKNRLRGTAWMSEDTNPQTITAQFAASAVSGLGIARHNLSSSASITLVLKLNGKIVKEIGPSPTVLYIPAGVFRAGIDPWEATYNEKVPHRLITQWFDSVICDEMQLTLHDPQNAAGKFIIERLFLGEAFSPEQNPENGVRLIHQQSYKHISTSRGAIVTSGNNATTRVMHLNFSMFNTTDRAYLETELNIVGANQDMLISIFPNADTLEEIQHTMVCVREPTLEFVRSDYMFDTTSLMLTEV